MEEDQAEMWRQCRKEEVKLLGSNAVYTRVEQMMGVLQVDPLFYKHQLLLFNWRYRTYLKEHPNSGTLYNQPISSIITNSTRMNDEHLAGLITTDFYKAIQTAESNMTTSVGSYKCREAAIKFLVPERWIKFLFFVLTKADCICVERCDPLANCKKIDTMKRHLAIELRNLLILYPESVPLIELAICSFCPPASLQEVCMRRVVELGLNQDWLPSGLKDIILRGPQLGQMGNKKIKMLECLAKSVKNANMKSTQQAREDFQMRQNPPYFTYLGRRGYQELLLLQNEVLCEAK